MKVSSKVCLNWTCNGNSGKRRRREEWNGTKKREGEWKIGGEKAIVRADHFLVRKFKQLKMEEGEGEVLCV